MALSVRAASGFQSGSATTTPIAITLPAGTTTNDLVYIIVSMNSVLATLTQSAGTGTYTNLVANATPANGDRNTTGGHTSWVFARTITAGDTAPSFTIGGTAGKYSWVAITIQPAAGGPVAAHISRAGPTIETVSGTSHTPPTLNAGTTTGLSLLANAWRAAANAATAVTTVPPTNWVEPANGDFSTATGTQAGVRQVAAEVSARTGQTGTITPGAQVTTSVAAFGNEYHLFSAEQTQHARTVTDNVGLTDSISVVLDVVGPGARPVIVHEQSRFQYLLRMGQPGQVFISAGVVEVPSAVDYTQTVTDPVGLLDTPAQVVAANRTITDTVGGLDSPVQNAAASQTITDAVGLLDSPTASQSWAQVLTDTVGVLDSPGQSAAASQTITNAVGLLDSPTASQSWVQVLTDTLGLLDTSVGVQGWAQALTDALGLLDTSAGVQGWAQALTDALGLSDAATKALTSTLTDALGLSDATAKALASSLTDAVGLLDTASQVSAATQALTDAVGLLDSTQVGSTGNITATITDAIGLLDSAVASSSYVQSRTEALGILDSFTQSAAAAPTVTDSVGLLDTTTQTAVAARSQTDSLGLLDATQQSTTGNIFATVTDGIGVADSATPTADVARVATDSIGLTDSRSQLYGLGVVLVDAVGLLDALTRLGTVQVALTDALGLVDEMQPTGSAVSPIMLPIVAGAPVNLAARGRAIVPLDRTVRGRPAIPVDRTTRVTIEHD